MEVDKPEQQQQQPPTCVTVIRWAAPGALGRPVIGITAEAFKAPASTLVDVSYEQCVERDVTTAMVGSAFDANSLAENAGERRSVLIQTLDFAGLGAYMPVVATGAGDLAVHVEVPVPLIRRKDAETAATPTTTPPTTRISMHLVRTAMPPAKRRNRAEPSPLPHPIHWWSAILPLVPMEVAAQDILICVAREICTAIEDYLFIRAAAAADSACPDTSIYRGGAGLYMDCIRYGHVQKTPGNADLVIISELRSQQGYVDDEGMSPFVVMAPWVTPCPEVTFYTPVPLPWPTQVLAETAELADFVCFAGEWLCRALSTRDLCIPWTHNTSFDVQLFRHQKVPVTLTPVMELGSVMCDQASAWRVMHTIEHAVREWAQYERDMAAAEECEIGFGASFTAMPSDEETLRPMRKRREPDVERKPADYDDVEGVQQNAPAHHTSLRGEGWVCTKNV
jgi:hypothetical protein